MQEFRLPHNYYDGNDAQYGNSLANQYHVDTFDMSGSIFDVFDYSNTEQLVSQAWIKVESGVNINFESSEGQLNAFTADTVFVDSNIDEECLDEGCGFQNNPFKTITRALDMINPTEDNPITIHLAAGTYSPDMGELFPIIMISNVNLIGENVDITIIDALQTNGVIQLENVSQSQISDITITNGYKVDAWNGWFISHSGAGMYLYNSNPELYNIIISQNISDGFGGGIFLKTSNPTLTNIIIKENTAGQGGGIYLNGYETYPILNNVIIVDNTAFWGGGIYLNESNPKLFNSIIFNNNGESGLGIYSMNNNPNIIPKITNSIIDDIYIWFDTTSPIITYSNIENGWEGEGNIDADPLFTDPENGDYTLQQDSPCIDSGTADLDGDGIDDITDYIGLAPDMGAYEFGESSEIMAGDTNFDGIVDILDIVITVNIIMGFEEAQTGQFETADINGDGLLDILDLVIMVNIILAD